MDLSTLALTLKRHWKLTMLLLYVAIAVTVVAVLRVQPTYTTSGRVLLVPPNTVSDNSGDTRTNPVLAFGPSLETFGGILSSVLNSDATAEKLHDQRLSTHYETVPEPDGPVISISVDAATPEVAAASYDLLRTELDRLALDKQQSSGAPKNQLVTTVTLTGPTTNISSSGRLRVGAALAALGVIATIGIVFIADLLGRRRRARRGAKGSPVAGDVERPPAEETPAAVASFRAQDDAAADDVLPRPRAVPVAPESERQWSEAEVRGHASSARD